jgi:predicted deacylase
MAGVEPVRVGNLKVEPGTKGFTALPVCTMGDGQPLAVPVHVIVGTRPGPRVAVFALQHGDELHTLGPVIEFVRKLNPQELSGSVLAVPVANPIAFEHGHRSAWIDSIFGDGGNMNRAWPGNPGGWITERTVNVMRSLLVDTSDYIIDLHDGNMGAPAFRIYYAYYYQTGGEYGELLKQLSFNFGQEIVVRVPVEKWPPYRLTTLDYYCFKQEKPFLCVELGDFWGFPEEQQGRTAPVRRATEVGATGLFNTLKYLKMLPGDPILPKRQLVVMPERHVRPGHGGILYSDYDSRHLGLVVPKGTVLGRIVSPYTLQELEVLETPFDSNCIIAVTDGAPLEFSRVNPGGYGYLCGDNATAEWIQPGTRSAPEMTAAGGKRT